MRAQPVDRLEKARTRLLRVGELATRHRESFVRHATPEKVLNLAKVFWERYRLRTEVRSYPFEIVLDITNRCNLRCPLCVTGQHKNERPYGAMAFDDFRRLVDELAPYLFKARLHSWGEPLLHGELMNMLEYLTSKNVGSEISTNLLLFRKEDALRLVDSGIEMLVVSMDGTTQEVYEAYRKGGRLETVMENIRALAEAKRSRGSRFPVIEVQFLLMKHNVHQAREIHRVARELGADRCRTFPVVLNVQDEQQRRAWLPEDARLCRYDPDTWQDRYYALNRACHWLWQSAVVNWDGTVSPCCIYEGSKTEMGGNAFRDGFRSVWNGPQYRIARKTFARRKHDRPSPGGPPICTTCRGRPRALTPGQQGVY